MDDIHDGARPTDRFYLEYSTPRMKAWGWDWLYRRVHWTIGYDWFTTHVLFWFIRWYWGTGKVDGSRTRAWWDSGHTGYVVTVTPSELRSFRLRYKKPDRERWDNMGGI